MPFGLSIGDANSKEYAIAISPTAEKVKVNIDYIRFEDDYDSACPICYYSENGISSDCTLDSSKATSITLESGQSFEFKTISGHNAKIW